MMIVLYDNWCPNCTRFSSLIGKLDWLHNIQFEKLRTFEEKDGFDKNLALKQMASYTIQWNYGFESIFQIFIRIPLLWILFPLLYVLKVSGLGQWIYMEFAVRRKIIPLHCDENSCNL